MVCARDEWRQMPEARGVAATSYMHWPMQIAECSLSQGMGHKKVACTNNQEGVISSSKPRSHNNEVHSSATHINQGTHRRSLAPQTRALAPSPFSSPAITSAAEQPAAAAAELAPEPQRALISLP